MTRQHNAHEHVCRSASSARFFTLVVPPRQIESYLLFHRLDPDNALIGIRPSSDVLADSGCNAEFLSLREQEHNTFNGAC